MKYTMIIPAMLLSILLLFGCGGADQSESAFAASSSESEDPAPEKPDAPNDTPAPPTTGAPAPPTGNPEGFPFIYNDITIHVGIPAEPILRKLGEPLHYFEAPSCAFEGIDRTYFYSGFELHTFPMGDADYILAVRFTDDSVKTPDGVYLGKSVIDTLAVLGGYDEYNNGMYTYIKGRGSLGVMTENGVVADLSYNFILH
ncbi:MAG: hypothetical protein FWE68_04185 [Defluviitaleaceae bacterium]|nr:hypothetical protein [Defluviitaleaceae bacterium]